MKTLVGTPDPDPRHEPGIRILTHYATLPTTTTAAGTATVTTTAAHSFIDWDPKS